MAYPDIHTCMRLTAENEELKLKLLKVKHQRDEAVSELKQIKESNKVNELLRNYVTTRDIYVQTESRISYPSLVKPVKRKEEDDTNDSKKSSTLLTLHSNLMKRYEKEVKQNMTHVENITNLNLGMIELEKKLKERTEEITRLEHDIKMLQIQAKSKARVKAMKQRSRLPEESSDDDQDDVSRLRKENKKMRKDIAKFKIELDGLDQGFFEEIEDIKYALQQSAKLNKIYEKTLRKTCMQFGVSYPNPERLLEGKR